MISPTLVLGRFNGNVDDHDRNNHYNDDRNNAQYDLAGTCGNLYCAAPAG